MKFLKRETTIVVIKMTELTKTDAAACCKICDNLLQSWKVTPYHDFAMNQFNATLRCIIALRHILLNRDMRLPRQLT